MKLLKRGWRRREEERTLQVAEWDAAILISDGGETIRVDLVLPGNQQGLDARPGECSLVVTCAVACVELLRDEHDEIFKMLVETANARLMLERLKH
jgi:hypothetical protein